MRRWMLPLLLATAGCQTTTEAETVQALGDPCTAQMPKTPVWDGSQIPFANEKQIYIVFAPVNGYSLAALVDPGAGTVPYARYVPTGKRNTFIALTQGNYGRVVTGGNPPPPDPITEELAAHLVFSAQRYLDVPLEAANDVASCKL